MIEIFLMETTAELSGTINILTVDDLMSQGPSPSAVVVLTGFIELSFLCTIDDVSNTHLSQ